MCIINNELFCIGFCLRLSYIKHFTFVTFLFLIFNLMLMKIFSTARYTETPPLFGLLLSLLPKPTVITIDLIGK